MRRGLGKGMGKGYKNIIGRDPRVHSQSAKGMKQPQYMKTGMVDKPPITKVIKTKFGWQVYVISPTAKSGYIPQGQAWPTKAQAIKDAQYFTIKNVDKPPITWDDWYNLKNKVALKLYKRGYTTVDAYEAAEVDGYIMYKLKIPIPKKMRFDPEGDIDKDGVKNKDDCRPLDKKKHQLEIEPEYDVGEISTEVFAEDGIEPEGYTPIEIKETKAEKKEGRLKKVLKEAVSGVKDYVQEAQREAEERREELAEYSDAQLRELAKRTQPTGIFGGNIFEDELLRRIRVQAEIEREELRQKAEQADYKRELKKELRERHKGGGIFG